MIKGNLTLSGFMGCGKSTLGPLLAKRLDMEFVDTDAYVERAAGMTIPEIFRRYTQAGFRDREHAAIAELSAREGLVLSTGGGTLTIPANVELLRQSGVVLYLNPGFEECYRRISGSDRPLVRENTKEGLARLYADREQLYRAAAHLELSFTGTPESWVDAAIDALASMP